MTKRHYSHASTFRRLVLAAVTGASKLAYEYSENYWIIKLERLALERGYIIKTVYSDGSVNTVQGKH